MTTCPSYLPGHNTHWIQARLAGAHPGTPVALRDPDEGWFTVVLPDGSEHRWWNHDADRVATACAIAQAVLCEPGPLLKIPTGDTVIPLYPLTHPVPSVADCPTP